MGIAPRSFCNILKIPIVYIVVGAGVGLVYNVFSGLRTVEEQWPKE